MPPVIQVVLGRILAALASAFLTWLIAKGVDIKVTQENIEALVAVGLGLFTTLYAVGHTWYNAKFNKKDVSNANLLPAAQADAKREIEQVKRERSQNETQ